ncbi:MAG: N-acetylglucosamine kinase [Bacteroidetes bacterium]|nr:N-acetylglucosamine kinase [Bacteroidota bacterium]
MCDIIANALKVVFTKAAISVDHDMVGSVVATCANKPGIACILGTGSNSCYFDGENIHEEVPALSYILGDEGSGAYFGKIILRKFLYKELPGWLHERLKKEYGLSKDVIFENVYQKSNANVYLASFMKALSDRTDDPFVGEMLVDGMKDFMKVHICKFEKFREVPSHFIGSVGYHFQDQLHMAADQLDVTVGKVLKKPIESLVDFHSS